MMHATQSGVTKSRRQLDGNLQEEKSHITSLVFDMESEIYSRQSAAFSVYESGGRKRFLWMLSF